MLAWRKAVLYGALLWLIPFAIAMVAFPLREMGSALFETTMAVTLATATAWLSVRFFKSEPGVTWRAGLRAGLVWMVISLLIDASMFSWGPMQMTLWGYLSDIGLTYLMIPAVAAAVGLASQRPEPA